MTDSLPDRLRAAIDAEEAQAHALPPFPWRVFPDDDDQVLAADDLPVAEAFALSSNQQRLVAEHIARHDPAAVLRRCAADRKILDLHRNDGGNCSTCRGEPEREVLWDGTDETWSWTSPPVEFPCGTVRALAEAYGVED